ncbi:hypothetical protein [Nitratireductor sp. XY-223]|uniref:hypothetical protein n=1 Tax=Nitratireductor sp. XY-223 TaxID=2561926 RepID=UPI0010A9DE4F|nr:hypothetical protein [Nitratireductor sp. XY-223]
MGILRKHAIPFAGNAKIMSVLQCNVVGKRMHGTSLGAHDLKAQRRHLQKQIRKLCREVADLRVENARLRVEAGKQ